MSTGKTLAELAHKDTYKTRWEAITAIVAGLPESTARLYVQTLLCHALEEMRHHEKENRKEHIHA